MRERLQKILARAGYGSRRACESLIRVGRVEVNGVVAGLGGKADPDKDKITVDGKPVVVGEGLVYIALYKPRGVFATLSSPDSRSTARDLVAAQGMLYPVGRLGVASEGLLLLTNDGNFVHHFSRPRYVIESEYRVLVARHPDAAQLDAWQQGVVLRDGLRTHPAEVRVESRFGKGSWLRVILKDERKRQIREMGVMTGLPVVRVVRIRIGSLGLSGLKPRQWRYLTARETSTLRQLVGLE